MSGYVPGAKTAARDLFWDCCFEKRDVQTCLQALDALAKVCEGGVNAKLWFMDGSLGPNTEVCSTPFGMATIYGHVPLVAALLADTQRGIGYNLTAFKSWTPFHYACAIGNVPMMELFLARSDINFNTLSNQQETPISSACTGGQLDAFRLLVARPDIRVDDHGNLLLYLACSVPGPQYLRLLLMRPEIDCNARCVKYGKTPFQAACWFGHLESVQLLLTCVGLERDALEKNNGESAFFLACRAGNPNVVRVLLLRDDININDTNLWGQRPLDFLSSGLIDLIVHFEGAVPMRLLEMRGSSNRTCLYTAARTGSRKLCATILRMLPNPNDKINYLWLKTDNGVNTVQASLLGGDADTSQFLELLAGRLRLKTLIMCREFAPSSSAPNAVTLLPQLVCQLLLEEPRYAFMASNECTMPPRAPPAVNKRGVDSPLLTTD